MRGAEHVSKAADVRGAEHVSKAAGMRDEQVSGAGMGDADRLEARTAAPIRNETTSAPAPSRSRLLVWVAAASFAGAIGLLGAAAWLLLS